jgi:hypothetical protein
MDMNEALSSCGVNEQSLKPEDKSFLDEMGYLVIPNVLPPELAARMAARLEEIALEEGENAGKDFQVEPGATRLGTLINKDPIFDPCFLHPLALAAVAHVMDEPFGLSSITSRAAAPNEGGQGMHRDSGNRACNILWMVTEFTPNNGPTRLVPGTHRYGVNPDRDMPDVQAKHPDEIYLTAPAGSMVAINGNIWHGGTRNHSDRTRHLISAFWTQRGIYQQEAHRLLNGAAKQRLSEAAQYIIDFEN